MTTMDPRAPWVKIDESSAIPRWECTRVQYLDVDEAEGKVSIFVQVQNDQGAPLSGISVMQAWPTDHAVQKTSNGTTDFPMSGDSSFSPDRAERGPYAISIAGGPSDVVSGLGLPLRRHVCYILTFQWIEQPEPPVIPPGDSGIYATQADLSALEAQLALRISQAEQAHAALIAKLRSL